MPKAITVTAKRYWRYIGGRSKKIGSGSMMTSLYKNYSLAYKWLEIFIIEESDSYEVLVIRYFAISRALVSLLLVQWSYSSETPYT